MLPARSSLTIAGRSRSRIFRALSQSSKLTSFGFFDPDGLTGPDLGVAVPLAAGLMFRDCILLASLLPRQTPRAFTMPVEAIM